MGRSEEARSLRVAVVDSTMDTRRFGQSCAPLSVFAHSFIHTFLFHSGFSCVMHV